VALAIAGFSLYFQFFNKKHSILYSTLKPKLNDSKKTLSIPILFKNVGNQSEVILDAYLNLEVKRDNESFLKRMSSQEEVEFPIVLTPNENSLLTLTGSYKDYLFGTFDISENNEMTYYPITVFDSLKLIANISYLSVAGVVASQEQVIGFISFDTKENIRRIDCIPIELRKLPIRKNDFHIISYSIIPQTYEVNLTIDLNDTNAIKRHKDKIQLINKLTHDSLQLFMK
jgi:hypothetical protein